MEILLWYPEVSEKIYGTPPPNLSCSFPEPFECEILPRNASAVELISQKLEDE